MANRGGHPTAKLAIVIIASVFVAGILFIAFAAPIASWINPGGNSIPINTNTGGSQTTAGSTPAPLYFTGQNAITRSALTGDLKVDIVNPNDLSGAIEAVNASSSAPFAITSGHFYTPGTSLLLHLIFPGYYGIVQTATVPSSTSLINNGVVYPLGTFFLYQRATVSNTAGVTFILYSPTGTTLSSTTTTAGSTGTYTVTTGVKQPTFSYSIKVVALSTSWGQSFPTMGSTSSNGQTTFFQQTRGAVAWLAVNNTAISPTSIQNGGWTLINNLPTGYYVFYQSLAAVTSTSATQATFSQSFQVDTSALAAGKHILLQLWFQDDELASDAQLGVSDGIPTAVGAFTAYDQSGGIKGFGYGTSAGAPTSPAVAAVITTG